MLQFVSLWELAAWLPHPPCKDNPTETHLGPVLFFLSRSRRHSALSFVIWHLLASDSMGCGDWSSGEPRSPPKGHPLPAPGEEGALRSDGQLLSASPRVPEGLLVTSPAAPALQGSALAWSCPGQWGGGANLTQLLHPPAAPGNSKLYLGNGPRCQTSFFGIPCALNAAFTAFSRLLGGGFSQNL